MQTLDARGLACPQPVVLARRAMAENEPCRILVDNEVAVANVTRMAKSAGWQTEVRQRESALHEIDLFPGSGQLETRAREPSARETGGSIVILLASDRIGEGEPELGSLLMRAFLHSLAEVQPRPDHLICMNAGVRLATEESPVRDDLVSLADGGTEVWLCGTCLDYYGLKDQVRVGTVSNMYSLAELLLNANRVVRP